MSGSKRLLCWEVFEEKPGGLEKPAMWLSGGEHIWARRKRACWNTQEV